MQTPFAAAIAQLCDEKGISKDKVIETIKAAIRAAYKKDYGTRDMIVDVDLDDNSGNATVFAVKTAVKTVENDEIEM